MRTKPSVLILFATLAAILAACQTESTVDAPTATAGNDAVPPSLNLGRDVTAFTAYELAYDRALEWDASAQLHLIPTTRSMEANLGLLGYIPSWFFMFKSPGSPVELYVSVYEGKISGITEAQPILGEQLPYTYLPLKVEEIPMDSEELLQAWLGRFGGDEYIVAHPDAQLDYRLVLLEGDEEPIWSIFDYAREDGPQHLLSIGASSGERTEEPFSRFR